MDYAVSITEKNRPKSKNDLDLLWWRWRQPKLRFGCCCATFAFICPFCSAKYGLCGFDYRKKQTQIENRFRSVMVEMASTEASLRLLLRNLRIYMSILLRKIWTMRFRLPKKTDPNRKSIQICYGGDGGNRNRVRKSIPANFYERSLSFKIPLKKRRQTGFPLRYPLGHDELQGYSFIHVHC